ncbi:hypothetical protein Acor_65390 [Acrocarpospora corrugata]|uniref:Uncharacterized protein n=1 Tax=Acrocarpospora corrugata TaxID=35763 RepID=A0A5M3WBP1_9ACTN|nr:DUF6247 family protein [Acrocarpospora corrugata]GES04471.1 hypothetical protein Acor_65390 [Acrocarpospora corrugata]
MSAQPHELANVSSPVLDRNLRSIRVALTVPQDREAFDAGLRLTLDEVRATLDLGKLNEFIHTWWLIAHDSIHDPAGRERMYAHAAQVQDLADHGQAVPRGDRTWRELLAERGVQA